MEAIVGLLSGFVSAIVIWIVARRSTRSQIIASQIRSDFTQIDTIFIQYPKLRPYFFDRQPIAPSDANYDQALAIARFLVNSFAFNLEFLSRYTELRKHDWVETGISRYYANSPLLCQYLENNLEEYPTTGERQLKLMRAAEAEALRRARLKAQTLPRQ